MKKILLMLLIVGIAATTGCGKKKEEEKPNDNKDNVQEDAPIVVTNPEDESDLTEADLAKIENSMDITQIDEDTTVITITYKNTSQKDYKVTKIKFTASKDKTEVFSTIKEFNDVVKPGETKDFKIEADITTDKLYPEGVNLSWEMVK